MSRRTNSRPRWLFLALCVIALASLDVEILLGENAAAAGALLAGGTVETRFERTGVSR